MHYIYKITNTKTAMSYVGETNNVKSRFASHKRRIKESVYTGRNSHCFINDAKDCSLSDFTFEVLFEFVPTSHENILLTESEYIALEETFYPNGYNCKKYTKDGWLISKEYINKYYPDIRGSNNPNFGNFWTDEMKKSLSDKAVNNHANSDSYGHGWREKIAQASSEMWASKSEEEKNKIMLKQSKSSSKFNYLQFDLNGNFIKRWQSIKEIMLANPTYKRAGINNAAQKYKPTYKGFVWEKELKC